MPDTQSKPQIESKSKTESNPSTPEKIYSYPLIAGALAKWGLETCKESLMNTSPSSALIFGYIGQLAFYLGLSYYALVGLKVLLNKLGISQTKHIFVRLPVAIVLISSLAWVSYKIKNRNFQIAIDSLEKLEFSGNKIFNEALNQDGNTNAEYLPCHYKEWLDSVKQYVNSNEVIQSSEEWRKAWPGSGNSLGEGFDEGGKGRGLKVPADIPKPNQAYASDINIHLGQMDKWLKKLKESVSW